MENNSFVLNLKCDVFYTQSDIITDQNRIAEEKKKLEKTNSTNVGKKIEHCNAIVCDLISDIKSPKPYV